GRSVSSSAREVIRSGSASQDTDHIRTGTRVPVCSSRRWAIPRLSGSVSERSVGVPNPPKARSGTVVPRCVPVVLAPPITTIVSGASAISAANAFRHAWRTGAAGSCSPVRTRNSSGGCGHHAVPTIMTAFPFWSRISRQASYGACRRAQAADTGDHVQDLSGLGDLVHPIDLGTVPGAHSRGGQGPGQALIDRCAEGLTDEVLVGQ